MHAFPTRPTWSRRLLLALLMLGMALAPVLVAMGNTYELVHGETAAQHDAAHAHGDDGDLLHAVAHCAGCGAHTPGLPPAPPMLGTLAIVQPACPDPGDAPARMPERLFRPPIVA
ncbi:hypothetical protein [Luteimonas sp. FCS-9]|uniref:hypothetical protein n=1 Tax=Luteimonas sp. FCS-9 TaxID=1547516 RepID=UPI00063ED2BB|nr:hypothetical protein [Luteimonas sp. FCS-9]KLI98993.1 hypothetical protein WQ56_13560 [Luteimonas sp. FCS-9]